jgi:hypothetical protein
LKKVWICEFLYGSDTHVNAFRCESRPTQAMIAQYARKEWEWEECEAKDIEYLVLWDLEGNILDLDPCDEAEG